MTLRHWNIEAWLGIELCCCVKWGGAYKNDYVQCQKRLDIWRTLIPEHVQYQLRAVITKVDYEIVKWGLHRTYEEFLPEYCNCIPEGARQMIYNRCKYIMRENDGYYDIKVLARVKKLLGAKDEPFTEKGVKAFGFIEGKVSKRQ